MSDLSEFRGPGFFVVFMQPKPSLPIEEFHRWYNTEHGPNRLKLDFMANGFRYKGRDTENQMWMACYDLKDISGLAEPRYTRLRANRSDREAKIISQEIKYCKCLDISFAITRYREVTRPSGQTDLCRLFKSWR